LRPSPIARPNPLQGNLGLTPLFYSRVDPYGRFDLESELPDRFASPFSIRSRAIDPRARSRRTTFIEAAPMQVTLECFVPPRR
jgi:hypothetical protein